MDRSDDEADPAVRKASDALRKARDALQKGHGESASTSTSSELVPWAATAEARRAPVAGAPRKHILGVLATVALGLAGLGIGTAAAKLVLPRDWPAAWFGGSTLEAQPDPLQAAAERLEQRLTESLGALKSEVAELRAAVARDQDDARATAVTKRLDELAARFDKAKGETRGAMAELAAKIDPLRQETAARLQSLVERLDRLERRGEAATMAKPPGTAARATAGPAEAAKKPALIRNWVVREVYDGIALVEGENGPVEVAPGEILPGAGRVMSIERTGRGWIVVTNRGVIDSARGQF